MKPLGRPAGIPLRRKLLFGALALLVLYSGYAWHAGLAFTAGIATQDMDWNGDGSVSTHEAMQSWYAVTVRNTREGKRECHSFFWRGQEDGQPIRVDCRTTFSEKDD
ncbi:MAG: EF-hand domain-containing protein [Luteimonas sp.]|nr:EF-hand domain-containing protein [Luteimonas sp.]